MFSIPSSSSSPYISNQGLGLVTLYIGNWELGSKFLGNWKIRDRYPKNDALKKVIPFEYCNLGYPNLSNLSGVGILRNTELSSSCSSCENCLAIFGGSSRLVSGKVGLFLFQMAMHGLDMGVIPTTYKSWDDPPSISPNAVKSLPSIASHHHL